MKKNLFAFLFSPKGVDQREVPQVSAEEIENGSPFGCQNGEAPLPFEDDNPHGEGDPRMTPVDPPFNYDDREPPIEPPPFHSVDDYPTRRVQNLKDDSFIWETSDGEELYLNYMAAPHVFYALRMIFNHSVPPAFRVGEFRRRAGVDLWPLTYRLQAGREMRKELANRTNELEPWMWLEMKDMEANADFLDEIEQGKATIQYTLRDGDSVDQIRKYLAEAMQTSPLTPLGERQAKAKAKRMRHAVPTDLRGFPGKRCMEHRSYSGAGKPRHDECNACKQVYRARKQRRKDPKFYRKA